MMQTQKQKVENGTSYSRAGTARPNAQSTCEDISDCHTRKYLIVFTLDRRQYSDHFSTKHTQHKVPLVKSPTCLNASFAT